MKTGTKLHFVSINDDNDKIEEFFVGGALPYKQYDGINWRVTYTILTDLQVEKTYVLDKTDEELFTSSQITVNDVLYKKILPVYDLYTLKQNLESRCTIIKGELPYNVQHGIPLKAQLQDTQLSILKIINDTPGVESCQVLSSKLVDKKFKLEVKIKSNFGTFITTVG